MDPKGARVLAERIASGPPRDEGEEPADAAGPTPPAAEPSLPRKEEPPADASPVETVYVKPRPAPRRDVRIYVRGQDGRLERSDL